jgi:HlyD family secretion protein
MGIPLKITIGALQDMTFDAALEYISPKATETNGANQFEIKAAVTVSRDADASKKGAAKIRSGYSANAEIVLARADKVLTIPESAIEFSGDSTFVYVLTDSTAEKNYDRRYVETGLSDGVNIEIKKGLTDKDKVRGPEIISDEDTEN